MESSKTAISVFEQAVIKAKVAQICDHVGYHAITQDSSNILADIYQHLIRSLARLCKEAANNNYRSESTLIDLVQACDFVGISVPSLQEHIETVKLPLKVEPQEADDDLRPSNRIQRNLLVDDLLESQKNNNNQTDGAENENGTKEQLDEEADKPLVPLLKDTYQEIASKFANCEPVTADKKIRLAGRIVLPLFTKLKINATIPTEPSTSGVGSLDAGETKASKKEKKKKIDKKKDELSETDSPSIKPIRTKKADKKNKIQTKQAEKKPKPPQEVELPPETAVNKEREDEEPKQSVVKVKREEKKNKVFEKKSKIASARSRQPVVRQPKGKRAKKLSREFILPEDDIDDELLNAAAAAASVTPLDLSAAEPPSFLPILDIKAESDAAILQQETILPPEQTSPQLPPPPSPPPQPPAKTTTSLLSTTKEKSTSESKQQKNKKKNKKTGNVTHITPLDPAIAEPPSFFPILEKSPKHEVDPPIVDKPIKTPDNPSTSLLKLPEPANTTSTTKQQKSKKKKKSSSGQFAIVSETVVTTDEKEWFCPACGGPDDGDLMVQCDKCQEWYHLGCTLLQKPPDDDENWECEICINKAKASQKKGHQPTLATDLPKPIPIKVPKLSIPSVSNDEHKQKQLKTPEPIMLATSLLAPQPEPSLAPPTTTVLDPDLCPECSLADDGTMMIQCDDPFCARWFHGKCVNLLEEPKEDESWFCKACVEKQQSAFKRRRRK